MVCIFINMGYLDNFSTYVILDNGKYRVCYGEGEWSGCVEYVRYDMPNLIMRGKPVYLMVSSDMGNIIEYIHRETPLSSKDLGLLQYEIREHSKGVLISFLGN